MDTMPFDTEQPRILIVKLSAIGDVIHATPVLCALRERFPKAYLAWAVEKAGGTLLEGHRALDELIVLPRGWLKSPKRVWQLRRRLHGLRFDVAIDVHSLTKSAILARLSGAPRRIGFGNRWGRELSPWLNNQRVDTNGPHMIEHNVGLLQPLGIERPRIRFELPPYEAEQATIDQYVAETDVAQGFCLINTGAGWPSKLWPSHRYAAVARHLLQAWAMPSVVAWAGDEERAMAERIVAASDGAARLAPPTTLRELACLARRATFFIGSDTGPLHLAVAVGTPCVGLHGPWPAERHGPYGPDHIALQKMFFEGATRMRRRLPPEFMEAIVVEDVVEACDRILGREERKKRSAA